MRRARATWLLFAAGLIVALAGLGWVTAAALDLDRREAASRTRADREESIRLALWRMDSAASPLVAAESARPYFLYSAFYPAQGAYTAMFQNIAPGRVRIASPLLTHRDPLVKLHFQIAEEGPVNQTPSWPTA